MHKNPKLALVDSIQPFTVFQFEHTGQMIDRIITNLSIDATYCSEATSHTRILSTFQFLLRMSPIPTYLPTCYY